MEQINDPTSPEPMPNPEEPTPRSAVFPTGGKELLFGLGAAVFGLALCNFLLYGGFNLGFSIACIGCMLCSMGYLAASGKRPTAYAGTVWLLCGVIAASFARSDDGFVKFVMVCFLLAGCNLALCLTAGQNRYRPGDVRTLLDAPITVFYHGIGRSDASARGLKQAFRRSGTLGQKGSAVLLGAAIAVPILAVMIPLLISADAAFDGLLKLLPRFDFQELFGTVFFGSMVAWVLYTRGVSLAHSTKKTLFLPGRYKGLNKLTVNTVLIAVCVVYVAYLFSQLAYFIGGFAGILPEEYTLAQYARRGFFEMGWLCAINLGIIAGAMGLLPRGEKAPLPTRLLCLFIGLVTVFFVATASAKMFLYIGSFGLTRLRVLTQTVMLFLALTTVLVAVWLFVPKFSYMKGVVICALVIGAAVSWADVDSFVARYNVDAYLTGKLSTVDVAYLNSLNDGAVPHIVRLSQEAPDARIAEKAAEVLENRSAYQAEDFRGWNYVNQAAYKYLSPGEDLPDETADAVQMPDFYPSAYSSLEFCVGKGYLCLRGWPGGSDQAEYFLMLPSGKTVGYGSTVHEIKAQCEGLSLDTEGFGDWIPLFESSFCTGVRYVGLRGRSVEADQDRWYILDMEQDLTYGPYLSEALYWEACHQFSAYPIGEWEVPEL